MYRDHSHLSQEGSLRLEPMFLQWFEVSGLSLQANSGNNP